MTTAAPRAILAATDLSPAGDCALRLAAAWSARTRAPLRAALFTTEDEAPAREALERSLHEALARAGAGGADALVVSAGPLEWMRERAAPDEWIVLGCEGTSATFLRKAGGLPAALAQDGVSPLLLAPLGWRGPERPRRRPPAGSALRGRRAAAPRPAFARVLVGVHPDAPGRERDAGLLAAGVAIVRAADRGRLLAVATSLDVAPTRHHPGGARDLVRAATDRSIAELEPLLRELALDALPLELATECPVLAHVVAQGPPERDLAGLARSQEIDLVVVGSGRVASRLVGFTPCPMLVVPRW